MTVMIRQIDSKSDRKKFVKMPWLIYKESILEPVEAAFFLAEREGVPVGLNFISTISLAFTAKMKFGGDILNMDLLYSSAPQR